MTKRLPLTLALLGCLAAPAEGATLDRPFGTETIANLAERAALAVVNIDTVARAKNPMAEMDPFFHQFFGNDLRRLPRYFEQKGVGSGFILDPSGLIVTNNHVTRGAQTIQVTLSDGRRLAGKVIGSDPESDLALVKVEGKNLPTLPLADPKRTRVGQWVVAIGSPLGLSTTVTAGIVSALNRDVAINERVAFIQTDAPINPGNSGGPLLNLDGQVIGVNTAIAAHAQGIGFAIPVETIQSVVQELRTKGKVEHAWLGVVITELSPERAKQLFRPTDPGVLVRDVADGGPASKAGLMNGDVILQVEGKAVTDPNQVIRAVAPMHVGDRLRLLVSREGQRKVLTVTLQAMPEKLQQSPDEPPVRAPSSGDE